MRDASDRVHRGAVAAMRNVDGHTDLIHTLHDLNAVGAEAGVSPVGRSPAEPVAAIGQLGDPLAETIKAVDILNGLKMRGVLLADQNADFAERLCPFELGRVLDPLELLAMRGDERIPPDDVLQRLGIDVAIRIPDSRVENGDSRISQA